MSHSTKYNLLGFLSVAFGIIAMLNPIQATGTAEFIASIGFVVAGGLQLYVALTDKTAQYRWVLGIFGVIMTLLGLYLLVRPVLGILVFTVMIASFLFIEGLAKIFLAFQTKASSGFWMILLSGFLSVTLAIMVFNNLAASVATLMGVLLAIELISNGFGLLAYATVPDIKDAKASQV